LNLIHCIIPFHSFLDFEQELKVADEFWDFIGGIGAYEYLLGCFERVGLEMREEIDKYFDKFNE
jgi:type II restriction enzyme